MLTFQYLILFRELSRSRGGAGTFILSLNKIGQSKTPRPFSRHLNKILVTINNGPFFRVQTSEPRDPKKMLRERRAAAIFQIYLELILHRRMRNGNVSGGAAR